MRRCLSCLIVFAALIVPGVGAGQAHAAAPVIGLASVSTMLTGVDHVAEAAQIRAAGGTAIRIAAKWNLVQPGGPADARWTSIDLAVAAARAAGLLVLLDLEGPAPYWAQRPGADPYANGNPPRDPAMFGTFARLAALRYSPYVSAWEIWNEPNLSHYLLPPTAATYVPLLRAASTAIRGTGSRQPVITGGTSSSRAETRDTTFIADLYRLGAAPYFDGVGVHPYTYPYALTADPRYGDGGGAAVLTAGRQTMIANGDAAKKMWVTEYGQATGTTAYSVSEAEQARILADAVNRFQAMPFIAAAFLFTTRDLWADPTVLDANFGLFRHNGTPKPAVDAVRAAIG